MKRKKVCMYGARYGVCISICVLYELFLCSIRLNHSLVG